MTIPPAPPAPAPGPAARRRGTVLKVAGVAIGVIAAGSVAGVLLLGGGGGGAGADSPEGAVRRLAAAVASEDVLGALQALAPEEVRDLDQLYNAALDQLAKQSFVRKEAPTAGLNLDVQGLQLSAQLLHPDVAKVSITSGRLGYSLDPAQLTELARGSAGEAQSGSITIEEVARQIREDPDAEHRASGLYLMAVRRGGKWFVSPFYTIAEYARETAGAPAADFTASRERAPAGAASPKEAVDRFLRAAASLDLDGIFASLPPDELGAVIDYKAAILQGLSGGELAALKSQFTITPKDIQLSESSLGADKAKVTIDKLSVEITVLGQTAEAQLSGTCLVASGPLASQSLCPFDQGGPQVKLLDPGKYSLIAVQERGTWYVSPLQTLVEFGKVAVTHAQSVIQALVGTRAVRVGPTGGPITVPAKVACVADVRTVQVAVQAFRAQNGSFPDDLSDLVPGFLPAIPSHPSFTIDYDADTGNVGSTPSCDSL